MLHRRGWIAAGAATFMLVVLARFPARWASWALPGGLQCHRLDGTLWNGACLGLSASRSPLGDVRWDLHPLGALLGRLSLTVSLVRAQGRARGQLDIRPLGSLTARDVRATFSLEPSAFPQLPRRIRGTLAANLSVVGWKANRITVIRGRIEATGLALVGGEPLGAYRVVFAGQHTDGEPVGRLSDLGGPFSVQGTVRLTPGPGYVVNGVVAARAGAPPALAAQLRYLGTPDAEGRRSFSVAGTF